MLPNTSPTKWDRLELKQLDNRFIAEIIGGLDCSRFEAQAILETVYKVFGPYFDSSPTLKPGQVLFTAISEDTAPNVQLNHARYVTVALTLDAGSDDLHIRRELGVPGLRRARMQRMSIEAFQQGGLLTVEDLAHRLLNCGERTISRDLAELENEGILLPLRSMVKDMGRALSHRELIIAQWLAGKEYSEIAHATHHSIAAVQNYVHAFKRIAALVDEGYDVHTISFLVKVSASLAEAYIALYQTVEAVPHRREELKNYLKKTLPLPAELRSI